uniref:guanylate cyclase n=1 Tax=Amphora coffeiformis TaxID=265554 RepID=A0A7S3LHW5_9STRA
MLFFTATILIWMSAVLPAFSVSYSDTFKLVNDTNGCTTILRDFNPLIHKSVYRVGVYTSEGEEEAFQQYKKTFEQYLAVTTGTRFDPPLRFEMVPVNLSSLANMAKKEEIDFFFGTAAVFSCMAAELNAQALVTIIHRREARGHIYDLDVYGGVIFTLATNEHINTIDDLKGKTIGAGGITMNGGGQAQFYEMWRSARLSYVADPLQVAFTGDERQTVQGVLDGDFEVGMARTDQIERHLDENGKPIDPDLFKVINPQIHVLDDGQLFPFVSSTSLHPEWPVAALDHVARDVSQEVQEALIALQDHATSIELGQNLRCETTPDIAELALSASADGDFVGFRPARSYFQVRTEQETAGFLMQNEKQESHCIRGETLYEDIRCPEGQYKVTKDEFENSCEMKGIECKPGYTCYCQPCVKAFEVAVFQTSDDRLSSNETSDEDGCDKMSLCGITEQTKDIHFEIIDNRKREDPIIDVTMYLDRDTLALDVEPHPTIPYRYQFSWKHDQTQIGIMNVFFDGEQIPQSPVRVQVLPRQCEIDFPGEKRSATESGGCACADGSMEIRGRCIESTITAVVISVVAVLLVSALGVCYVRYRTHKNDEMWQVNIDELTFDDPPEVIGQGSFGVVLLAQYRGTNVALKRALKVGSKGSKHGSKRGSRSLRGASKPSSEHSRTSSGRNNTDSIGMETISSNNSRRESDPESGEGRSDEESLASEGVSSANRTQSFGRSNHSSYNPNSLGFLAEDYGRPSKLAWLFPWKKKNSYHSRFKEAILGSGGGSVSLGKSWHAMLCPWFSPQVRAEEAFMQEMRVLSRLRHPCITTVLGAVVSRSHDPMLVMEYMEYGSLHDLLRNETMALSGEIILQISRDVAQGLRFLHSSKPPLLHGDMKARNILVDSRFRAKLCDFGLATKKQNLITGTPFWLAPEYLRGQTQYTTYCDIYSVGIILYEIYSREDPYKGEDFRDTLRKVCDRRVNKRPGVPPTCPPKIVDLMKKCWNPDAVARPSARELDTTLLDMSIRDAEPLTTEEQMVAREKRSKGDMLYELFPKHVADQLKAGQKVEPEQHDEVTVVFSDIVHFTDISRALTPMKVSQMLDRLYLAFDKVARKNSVFKVETIGDAYMGVTNLDKAQMDTHAKNAANFAIDLVNEASKIVIDEEDPSKGYINIRVGFHSGPVVSNVIGSLNPRYGLFGDTVNTSSRMESNSKANRILCSEASYKLLEEQAPEISVKKRGRIAVKGKGDMNVYWVGDNLIEIGKLGGPVLKDEKVVAFEGVADSSHNGEDFQEPTGVDEKLWRREMQTKLHHLDSGPKDMEDVVECAPPKHEKKKDVHRQVSNQGEKKNEVFKVKRTAAGSW